MGRAHIPRLFRTYFFPTLIGMLSICALTAVDGIFVGHGVGSDGLAAVNITYAPIMMLTGVGLMLGMGGSVVASIHLAAGRVRAARFNVTQALGMGTLFMLTFVIVTMARPELTARLLGSSETLLQLTLDYMRWIFPMQVFQVWCTIGLFVVRLDGAPKYAMWCNIIPAGLNIILDYLFIFPLGMGLEGASLATFLSVMVGGIMVMVYLLRFATTLRLIRIKTSRKSLMLSLRNIGYQCKVGVSAFLGESTMGMLMLIGNVVFMAYLGDDGVGAFSIACYYAPFVFMMGNAIAQSAQPIVSYNYGLGSFDRVRATVRLAIATAVMVGVGLTLVFFFGARGLVALFLEGETPTVSIAVAGLPVFALAFVFFIFNLTAIGYFQSVERVWPSVVFAFLRGVVFLVPAFLVLPRLFGVPGIWAALPVSEVLTSICVVSFYLWHRSKQQGGR